MATFRLVMLVSLFVCVGALSSICEAATPIEGGVDPARVSQIARTMPTGSFAFGPTISDRAAWTRLAAHPAFKSAVHFAEKFADSPVPEMTEAIYSEFVKTGTRTANYAHTRSARYDRIDAYVLAECIENKGRFLEPLKRLTISICDEPTWVYNFHDPKLEMWKGKITHVDLGSVVPAQSFAEALHLLGDRLDSDTRQLIRSNIRRRILDPYRASVEGTGRKLWWTAAEMNWNSVCTAGVVNSALAVCDSPEEKAWYVAAGEKSMHNYLAGFGSDGLCPEGLGYWNYGYGNFVVLAEAIWQASGGKVDLYAMPGAKAAALYPVRLEIINGIWPALADSPPEPTPGDSLMPFINKRYALGIPRWHRDDLTSRSKYMAETMMYSSPSSATAQAAPAVGHGFHETRSWFDHGGVLVCRPMQDAAGKLQGNLGVCIKGGVNDGPHYHQDLGTFIVVVGDQPLILDPGAEVYTARTFSKNRFKSALLNSYGHPVPLVAGKIQRAGKNAVAKIIQATFTDAADTLAMDLRSAYAVPELSRLIRTFIYRRGAAGPSLTVTDDVAYSSPQAFGNALITYGQWKRIGDGVRIEQGGQSVDVSIDTGGIPFDITAEPIDEASDAKGHAKPTRIGINLKQPISSARVTLSIAASDASRK